MRILQVVVVNLLDGLEVNDSLHLGLVFVCGAQSETSRQPVVISVADDDDDNSTLTPHLRSR